MTHYIDRLIRSKTGFTSLSDMLEAGGNYRPTCCVYDPDMEAIADAYDDAQFCRNDDRRARRYGTRPRTIAAARVRARHARAVALEDGTGAGRWRRNREPVLTALDANGNRIDDGAWQWDWRAGTLRLFLERHPASVEVSVDSGIDFAANRDEMENGGLYETEFWSADLWWAGDQS